MNLGVDEARIGDEQFNMHNTFETFVIGPGNRFPHAASLAVCRKHQHKHTTHYLSMVA
ncbi:chromosome replication initiator DnaA [Staphylococcus gallinarum]|uniref:Chromosome replication initiator DnaA n=1 Tax=Staphylococcus gallinarum TaxID=1293 RepID=A0A380FC15_STAGA|nr:chromosome replication initiator DnaA [Staphylococcus gallinarum]